MDGHAETQSYAVEDRLLKRRHDVQLDQRKDDDRDPDEGIENIVHPKPPRGDGKLGIHWQQQHEIEAAPVRMSSGNSARLT